MAAAGTVAGYDRMKEVKEFDESKMGVKGLSDSGITTIPKFFVHPPETLSGLKSSSTSTGIPVIDLSNMESDSSRAKIVEQIRVAAKTWGFFQVINHGVPVSVLFNLQVFFFFCESRVIIYGVYSLVVHAWFIN